jgi:uncharacterized OB-fold protein
VSRTETTPQAAESDALLDRLRSLVGKPSGPQRSAAEPVNTAMIRHWCEALGDANPAYTDPQFASWSVHGGIVAPPTMLQAWTMPGLGRGQSSGGPPNPGSPGPDVNVILEEAGYTSVVATDCEQTYDRYLRPGDTVSSTNQIESVSDRKKTALGTGYFVTVLTTYCDAAGATVGRQRFRLFYFRPPDRSAAGEPAAAPQRRPRPAINQDTEFFWDGAKRGELLVQRCSSCGVLRHPPRTMCGECGSFDWEPLRASGRGVVYSFVLHHYPPVPGFDVPYAVALIELEEGTRLVSNVVGIPATEVRIGMPVEVDFLKIDDELTLPVFRPRGEA